MERVAIVGMGCRFPGAANPKAFWQLLKGGVDAVREIPADRWSVASFFDANPAARGKTYARWGGFLDKIDEFDAGFFGISPREAASLDPQQRLLLEVTWEALEDAGQVPDHLCGEPVGVFMGGFTLDYMTLQLGARNRDLITTHTATGSLMTLLSNRISYAFDFRGPSISVDTACSGSLVSVHLACQALKNNECKIAIAGGVNVMCTPEYFIAESKGGFLSPDGRCKTFDARANGYVRGEGAGVVILKPLDQAIADADTIYAVIRGTAVNQDGRSNGITQPRREAQEALIREACARAEVMPADIQYIEAHGTGTAAGDPIEANAIGNVFSVGRTPQRPCIVGSLKTNVGHMEAAAGIAGLIKTSLCLKHAEIPPILHFENANPQISFDDLKLKPATELQPWPKTNGPKLAAVNSFGFGGTNAHAILEDAPEQQFTHDDNQRPSEVLAISAQTSEALDDFARSYHDFLASEGSNIKLADICYSANVRRTSHDHRLTVCGHSHEDMQTKLREVLAGESALGVYRARRTGNVRPKLAFVFTGMGPQWWSMGRQLYGSEPVFRAALETCEEAFQRLTSWPMMAALLADEQESRMSSPMVAQTTNFALQVALVELWRSWGIVPDAITGHSAGEPAAAWASGCLNLDDAVLVNYHRSRLIERVAGQGAMMTVQMPVDEAERVIAPYRNVLSIAAENAPMSVTLSGDPAALEEVGAELQKLGTMAKILRVNVAYHSYQLEPLKEEMIQSVCQVRQQAGNIPLYSTVTGNLVADNTLDARYWWRNLRNCVNFRDTADLLIDHGHTIFLEIGPHPVLTAPLAECLSNKGKTGVVFPSIRRGEDEAVVSRGSLGALHTHGFPVDWRRIYPAGNLVSLPAYPWQRERYWLESDDSRQNRLGEFVHPLLGRRLSTPQPAWEIDISRNSVPFITDHAVKGAIVFPGAGYVEMSLAAAEALYGPGDYVVEGLTFDKALFIADSDTVRVHITMDRESGAFSIHRQPDNATGAWILVAGGSVSLRQATLKEERVDPSAIAVECGSEIDRAECYQFFADQGFQYGPRFQRVKSVKRGVEQAIAVINADVTEEESNFAIHPTVLDACFQVLIATNPFGDANVTYMPVGIDRVTVYRRPKGIMTCHARLGSRSQKSISGDLSLFDELGQVAVRIEGFRVMTIDGAQTHGSLSNIDNCFFEIEWKPASLERGEVDRERSNWLIVSDSGGVGERLAEVLREKGDDANVFDRTMPTAEFVPESSSFAGILYLRTLDRTELSDITDDCIEVMQITRSVASLAKPPKVWIVTRGAQRVSGSESKLYPSQGSLWGLGRVIGNQENTGLWGGLIDLDPDVSPDECKLLAAELSRPNNEEIAFRNSARFVSRLVRRKTAASALAPRFGADGAYLITGGLGSLGILTARWLVQRGARELILAGRTALPSREDWETLPEDHAASERVGALLDLEAMGARVHVAAVDVADENELAKFLMAHDAAGGKPLRGVVHSAGVVRDALLMHMEDEQFREVMRPKVAGALALHRQTLRYPLDFFVIFSSIGSVVVSTGQANYAAANAFLDSLAGYRQMHGLPCMSINWGPWATGMVAKLDLIEHLTARGMAPITEQAGTLMMDRLFGRREAQIAALHADWPAIFDRQPIIPPMILHLGSDAADSDNKGDNGTRTNIRDRVMEAPSEQRAALVESCLLDLSAKVLRLERSKLDVENSLVSLGLDSLMAIELKNRVELALGVTPPVVDLLRGLTTREIAARLLQQLEAAPSLQLAEQPAVIDLAEAERALSEADPALLNELIAGLNEDADDLKRLTAA